MNKIVTYYDVMDELWFAYYEDRSEDAGSGEYGYGLTEEEAIKELKESCYGKD